MKRHMLMPGQLRTLCGKEGLSIWTQCRTEPATRKGLSDCRAMLADGNYLFMLEGPGRPLSCVQCLETLRKMGLAQLTCTTAAV